MEMEKIGDNDLFTGREVKRMMRELLDGEGDVEVTTVEASAMLGHSPDWWRRAAPDIAGARQEANGGPWTLPLRACREHVASLRRKGKLRRRDGGARSFGRKPWKGQPPSQIAAVP